MQEEFEDTKGAIRNCISKIKRQHNGQKKKLKRTNNDRQNIHIKLKIEYKTPTSTVFIFKKIHINQRIFIMKCNKSKGWNKRPQCTKMT